MRNTQEIAHLEREKKSAISAAHYWNNKLRDTHRRIRELDSDDPQLLELTQRTLIGQATLAQDAENLFKEASKKLDKLKRSRKPRYRELGYAP